MWDYVLADLYLSSSLFDKGDAMSVNNKHAQSNEATVDLRSIRERAVSILKKDEDHGNALIELAVTLPPLLLVATGIWVMGFAMNNYLILTNATTVAARQLSISRGQTLDPCAVAVAALKAVAPTLTPGSFTYSFTLNTTTYTGSSCSSGSYTTGAPSNLVQGQPASMTVNYPCSLQAYKANFAPTCNLQAQMTELVQ